MNNIYRNEKPVNQGIQKITFRKVEILIQNSSVDIHGLISTNIHARKFLCIILNQNLFSIDVRKNVSCPGFIHWETKCHGIGVYYCVGPF